MTLDKADRALRKRTAKIIAIFLVIVGVFGGLAIWWLFAAKISIIAVRGDSMEPALSNGDNIALQQITAPRKGMIIVFEKPKSWQYMGEDDKILVKRIAAVPQDVLSYDGEAFYVNDELIYRLSDDNYQCDAGPIGYEHRLTQKEVFALGDNASVSLDSRRIFCDGNPENAFIGIRDVIDFGTIERIF